MLDIIKTIDASKEVIKEICLVGFANDEEKIEKFYNSYIKKKIKFYSMFRFLRKKKTIVSVVYF